MMNYHFTLAGLRILLRTPYEITVSDSLRPFLCRPFETADCTITLEACPQLPAPLDEGAWHGAEFYDRPRGSSRIFHYDTARTAAFAVTELFENGNITVAVLPEYLSYFTGTSGIFNRIGLETLLLQHNALLLHASLIKYAGKTLAFSGPSGVGKSTQAEIWRSCLGAEVLNGDRAALRNENNTPMAYGSPYAGTSGIYHNDGAPLYAIILLQQAQENRLHRLTPGEAFCHIYPELSVHHWEKYSVAKATDLCLQLLQITPVYLLECRPEESAALLVKKGLGL